MATEKLYWNDPFALTFMTLGAATSTWDGKPSVVLPATGFYPEAGGQLGDTGWLDVGAARVRVADTQVDDDGVIHHVVDALPSGGALALPAESAVEAVRGSIDRDRRLDHMAHHTAQHMLSSALDEVARAATVSARLGLGTCTIDLDVPGISDANLARAEDLVNAVIRDDVAIRAFFPTPDELAKLDLRRAPKVAEGVRVIDIEGFDLSPCGGTHCTRSGQVGVVRVAATEKYKGKVRLSFHAAARALAEMRSRDLVLGALTQDLTCGPADVTAAVARLKADLRGARESLGQSRAELARMVADAALAAHPASPGLPETRIVVVRDGDDVATLRVLAGRLAERPDVVAVCAAPMDAESHAVVIQRGSAVAFDCGAWLKRAAATHGGRGGGRPERAEGKLPRGAVEGGVLGVA